MERHQTHLMMMMREVDNRTYRDGVRRKIENVESLTCQGRKIYQDEEEDEYRLFFSHLKIPYTQLHEHECNVKANRTIYCN